MVRRVRWPVVAWAGLTAYVCLADLALVRAKQDTLSTAFRDAVHHPIKRWPVGVLWTFLTAHLFLNLPWDPLRKIGERISATSNMV